MQLSAPVQAEIESFQDDSDVDVESDGSACVYEAHGNRLKRIVLGFLPVGW